MRNVGGAGQASDHGIADQELPAAVPSRDEGGPVDRGRGCGRERQGVEAEPTRLVVEPEVAEIGKRLGGRPHLHPERLRTLGLVPVLRAERQSRHVQGKVGNLEQPGRVIGQGEGRTLCVVAGFTERDLSFAPSHETRRGNDQHQRECPHHEADPADRPPELTRQGAD